MKTIRSRRSVSPVIAIVLLFGLAIAGAATTAVVYNNAVNETPGVGSAETIPEFAGSGESATVSPSTITSSIVEMGQNTQTGTISSVKVQVTNNGNETVYVQSAEVIAGSTSSDSQWDITAVEGATPVDVNGGPFEEGDQFGGYAIPPGQTATFTVSETSGNPVHQIPQEQANLMSVNLKGGNQPGINNMRVQASTIALADPMAPRSIHAALLHYEGRTDHSKRNWVNLFTSEFFAGSMETKGIDFVFDKREDVYSFRNADHGLNATELSETYDVIVISMWAVHENIADLVSELFDLGVPMVFYGSIDKFNGDDIDFATTDNIVGLAPVTGFDDDAEDLVFSVNSDPINVLAGLDISNLPVLEEDDHFEIDDEDLANTTVATPIAFATSTEDDGITVTALAYRDGTARVVSSPLDPHEAHKDTESVFELVLPRNMILAAVDEGHRLTQEGTITFESISFDTYRRDHHQIRPSVTATVEGGDINLMAGDLTFEFTMPDGMEFEMDHHAKARIEIESSGMSRTYVTTDSIERDGNILRFTLEMDHHRNHKGDRSLLYLFDGDNITITLPVRSSNSLRWMEIDEDVDLSAQFEWTISADWYGMDGISHSATEIFTEAVLQTSALSQPILNNKS